MNKYKLILKHINVTSYITIQKKKGFNYLKLCLHTLVKQITVMSTTLINWLLKYTESGRQILTYPPKTWQIISNKFIIVNNFSETQLQPSISSWSCFEPLMFIAAVQFKSRLHVIFIGLRHYRTKPRRKN